MYFDVKASNPCNLVISNPVKDFYCIFFLIVSYVTLIIHNLGTCLRSYNFFSFYNLPLHSRLRLKFDLHQYTFISLNFSTLYDPYTVSDTLHSWIYILILLSFSFLLVFFIFSFLHSLCLFFSFLLSFLLFCTSIAENTLPTLFNTSIRQSFASLFFLSFLNS